MAEVHGFCDDLLPQLFHHCYWGGLHFTDVEFEGLITVSEHVEHAYKDLRGQAM